MEEQLAQYGLTAEEAAAIYQDLGDLPVAIWIDSESKLPVKYEMDMTGLLPNLKIGKQAYSYIRSFLPKELYA